MKKEEVGFAFCNHELVEKTCSYVLLQFLVSFALVVSPLLAASPELVVPDGQSISFKQMDKLLAGDGATGDHFGGSVAISGDTVVIGSAYDDDNEFNSGAAYIFTRSDGSWNQVQKLTADDGAANDNFGYSVAISGETVVIGSLQNDGNGQYSGAAYIFESSDAGWRQVQKLLADDGAEREFFGSSVAISGDTVVIGSDSAGVSGAAYGAAYIFERADGVWGQVQKLTAADGAADDYFGQSVAISEETVIIGSYMDDDNGATSGSAYIFESSDGVWRQVQKLTAADGAADDYFGSSVAISGNTVVISSNSGDDIGSGSGSVYIFENSDGVWSQVQRLTAADGAADVFFGGSIAICGETVVIGSFMDNFDMSLSGSAHIFERSSDGVWRQVQKITAEDVVAEDVFGISVAISGDTVLVGSEDNDDNGSLSGSSYIFKTAPHYNRLEEKRPAIVLEADDSNSDYPISFSLLSGLDGSLFTLDTSGPDSALLQFTTSPDFEAPADSNGDNLYELYLQLVDTAGEVNKYKLTVRVGDIPYEETLPRALTYQELQTLQASLPTEEARFGNSVAISGETAVVGASGLGRAYVYVFSEITQEYEYMADLRPNVAGEVSAFGQDVAISGDAIAVVDPWNDEFTGKVYIFEKPAAGWSGTLGETAFVVGSDSAVYDYFGTSVDINGESMIIGAHADDDHGVDSGSAYIFQNVNGDWTETAKLTASDGAAIDNFGVSVAISGDAVVVGSFRDDGAGVENVGSVYLYEKPYQGWVTTTENAKLIAADGEQDDRFGLQVDINGDVVVVGTSGSLTTYLFEKPLTGWNGTLTQNAIFSPLTSVDSFGPAVAIERDLVVVGAAGDDENGADAGAIYLFEKPTDGWGGTVNETFKFISESVVGDQLGAGVAIDRSMIFAGATGDDTGETDAGAAYVLQGRFVPGDVNNSTTVELADIIMALQVLTGSADGNIVAQADVNGDEKIGLPEAMFSLHEIAEE